MIKRDQISNILYINYNISFKDNCLSKEKYYNVNLLFLLQTKTKKTQMKLDNKSDNLFNNSLER